MKAKIRFSVPEEFLVELESKGLVEPIVRVTKQFEDSKMSPNIQHVFILATALRVVGEVAQIIELKRYCGDYWGKEFEQKTLDRAQEIQDEIEKRAKALMLEVRAGVYE
jgi:hypothetical protein